MHVYNAETQLGSLTASRHAKRKYVPRLDDNIRKCEVYFPRHERFPITTNILHSLLIENYYNIYKHLDYSRLSTIQYVSYKKGEFFKKHNDVVQSQENVFRAITMSINLSEADTYTGGNLVVYNNKDEIVATLDKDIGSFIIIPAFLNHEAQIVDDGRREAIVTWLHSDKHQLDQFHRTYNSRDT